MGYWDAPSGADNSPVVRPRLDAARLWLAVLVVLAQMVALVPTVDAQEVGRSRATATWLPRTIPARELAGVCPLGDVPDAPCPIVRGVTYRTSVTFSVDRAVQPLVLEPIGNGLEIVATSRATGAEFTRRLAAHQSETIDLAVTVPG